MTLGDKIRKYRILCKKTQKQLGEEVGFKKSTADVRINQYETNKMAPKDDIRRKLAEQLDVDMSALSDISITSLEDVMQILFFFEEKFGMKISRDKEKTTLTFMNNNRDKDTMDTLSSYLYYWYIKSRSVNPDDPESDVEYRKWKGRFPRDLESYWTDQCNRLDNTYKPIVAEYNEKLDPIKNKSELIEQIRLMIESGLSIESDTISYGADDGGLIITLLLSELFDESNTKTTDAFARFLFCLESLEEYGMHIYRDISSNEKGTQMSYTLRYSPLMTIRGDIDKLNEYYINKDKLNDLDIEMFEESYKDKLKTYDEDLSGIYYDAIYYG